jgi:glutaredoxin-like protein
MMSYDALVISAHPDDAASQMGGTLAKLSEKGQRMLLVDLIDGEPTAFAERGVRAQQADEAARILGVERLSLGLQDRFVTDTPEIRLQVARLIREHRPRWVYSTGEACVHPDHAAVVRLIRAAVFLARLGQWERVPGRELLANQDPWVVDRLFFPHCKLEPPWGDFAFAVDVSRVYDRKRQALAIYQSRFLGKDEHLLALYEAEDRSYGRLLGVAYAEMFRSAAPLLVEDRRCLLPFKRAKHASSRRFLQKRVREQKNRPLLSIQEQHTLQQLFEGLEGEVTITTFTQRASPLLVPGQQCDSCEKTRALLAEVTALSDKLHLETQEVVRERQEAERLEVTHLPAFVLQGRAKGTVRFFGIPAGYALSTLVEDLLDLSTGTTNLSEQARTALLDVKQDLHVQVFVTPTCPYCPSVARLAHQLAIENEHITADVIDISEFIDLAQRYRVQGVPKTVINDRVEFAGALPEPRFVQQVLQALDKG